MELTAFIRDKGNLEPYIDWDYPALAKDTFIKLIGKGVKVKVTRRNKPVTPPQFRYLYGVAYPILQVWFLENWGEQMSIEDIDVMYKMKFWCKEINGYKIPQSKTKMSTVDMNNYINNIQFDSSMNLGVNIPDPNEGEAE